jgi:oxygen-dependent protoporphyrinogen oxidase
VVVVGGGIAGLAAAHRLRELGPDLEIVVVERADRLGGKIHTVPFAGQPVETGAETFLMREAGPGSGESAALALAGRVGLADALVHPSPAPAALALEGELRLIPGATLMGVPADPDAVKDVATVAGRDTDDGRPLLAPGEDVTVGSLVRARMGDEVTDRLVDPLLGGVYAGRADDLSLQATMAGLHRAAQVDHTLAQAVASALRAAPRPPGTPAFASVHGGLSRFVGAVTGAARARVELGQTVRGLTRTSGGWRVGTGTGGRSVDAGAVVLAVPAAAAARLLSEVDAAVAEVVGRLEYASVALVTLALPARTVLPELSGFLVPADQGYAVKAATFLTTKWPHLRSDAGGAVVVRASLGRHGEAGTLRLTDEALVSLVRAELARLIGDELPEPLGARVTRWGGGLPQYGVGHVERVATVRSALARRSRVEPGARPASLALAGAAYDGVGIAACVRSGEAAAEQVWGAIR